MKRSTLPQLQIVVLAAGYSLRLGQPKALVRVQGVSLVRRAVTMMAPFARPAIIVVAPPRSSRYRIELRALPATLIVNRHRSQGLSSSVRCAISHARTAAAVLLLPVDLVRLQRREVSRLIAAWRGTRRRVVARRIGPAAGIPLILPRWIFRRALCIEGDLGLREFVKLLPQEQLRLMDLASAQTDVDTPRDLAFARHSRRNVALRDYQPG